MCLVGNTKELYWPGLKEEKTEVHHLHRIYKFQKDVVLGFKYELITNFIV